MARGKVESSTPNGTEWTDKNGKKNNNFVIKFEGANDTPEKPDRYIFVSESKENDVFVVGKELDYKIKTKQDGTQWEVRATAGGKTYSFPVIELPKQNGYNGGGGGNKNQPQTPEQIKNGLVSYLGGYAKEIIIHRVNLGKEPKDIIAIYEELLDGFMKASIKHIK